EEAAARVIAAPPGAPLPAWAAAPARVGPPAAARPSEGQRLLLIGDLDAAPVDLRARRDWPSARPSPAALGRQLGRVEGLGCGGRGPAPLRREPGPAAG
ncbi:MAG: hypothetical protein RL071_4000, partial [Pseudomonadota bacterium]